MDDVTDDPLLTPEVELARDLAELVNAGDPEPYKAVPLALKAMDAGTSDLAVLATVLAGRLGAAGLAVLEKAQISEDVAVRRLAAQSLGNIDKEKPVIDALSRSACDDDDIAVEIATMELGRRGADAITPLRMLIGHTNPQTAIRAIRALGYAARGSGMHLFELEDPTFDDEPHRAVATAEATIRCEVAPDMGIETLRSLLGHRSAAVRCDALKSVARLMELAEPIGPMVLKSLSHDDDAEVRANAAIALALVGRDTAQTVQDLALALRDRETVVQRAAAISLASFEGRAINAAPSLRALAQTIEDKDHLQVVNAALLRIGAEQE